MDEKKKKLIDRETPAEKEIEGDPSTWWYVCPECHTAVDPGDRYCRECGQRLK